MSDEKMLNDKYTMETKNQQHPGHNQQLVALKRIEGQVRGIQKMIEERRYCVEILTQISSVNGALLRVYDHILQRHVGACVKSALKGKSEEERQAKIDEIVKLLKQSRKNS